MTIDSRAYKHHTDTIEPGATLRINHLDCPAGEDTRRRLYISRPLSNPTKVLFYCHNCQSNGIMSDSNYKAFRDTRHAGTPSYSGLQKVDEIIKPKGLIYPIKDWPVYAQAWIMKGVDDVQDAQTMGIAYDPSSDRVYLPRYKKWYYMDGDSDQLIGYQLRDVTGRGSKYLTVQKKDEEPYSTLEPHLASGKPNKKYAIIVEDLLSGIALASACTSMQSALPMIFINYGIKIQNYMLWSMKDMEWIQVWLDNDSPHVNKQAAALARTAQLFNPHANVSIVKEVSDPKNYAKEDIVQIMDDSWTQ